MIKIIYDCKLGTQNLFIKLNNEMNEVIFQEDAEEEEAELYAFLKEASEEYKIEYIQELTSEMICDMLFDYFSQKVLRDTKFVEEADIFDIENIKIIKSKKTVRNMLEPSSLKASDVMNILHITRPTLCKYVKQGLVKIDSEVNGKYKYNRESVYALLNGKKEGETKMNLSEKLKLNYPKTTALEKVKNDYYARFDNNSSNSYNGIYEYCLAIKEKQDKGLVVKDEEYSLVPNGKGVCDNPYDGYYLVNFHYALHYPETILDKDIFEEQLKAFIEQAEKDGHKNYNMDTTLKWFYNSIKRLNMEEDIITLINKSIHDIVDRKEEAEKVFDSLKKDLRTTGNLKLTLELICKQLECRLPEDLYTCYKNELDLLSSKYELEN